MDFTLKYRSRIIRDAYRDWISVSKRVVDIGCGNAVVTSELSRYFQCSILGVDVFDYRKISIPFKLLSEPDKLPFKDKEFDISMFNDALHHCEKWEALLNEALRISNNVLIFEMEPTITAKILDCFINKIHYSAMEKAINLKTIGQWEAYFERLGVRFQSRRIDKPSLFYPFCHFAFNVSNNT